MSGSPDRRARRARDRKVKIPADASVIVAVNVPSGNYEAEVRRVLKLIGQAGYDCHAMTGEFILKMAADIQHDLDAAANAEALVADAALKAAPTTEGDEHHGS